MSKTILQKKLSKLIDWDPADNQAGYKINADDLKVRKEIDDLMWEWFKEDGIRVTKKELTCVDKMSIMTLLLWAYDYVDTDEINHIVGEGIKEYGRYKFPMDAGEEYIKACEKVLEENFKLRGKTMESIKLRKLDGELAKAVDGIMKTTGNPTFNSIVSAWEEGGLGVDVLSSEEYRSLEEAYNVLTIESEEEVNRLKDLLSKELSKPSIPEEMTVESDGTIPDGSMKMVKASTIFGEDKILQDFDVPFWEWDGVHPDVPKQDENYIFRPSELTRVLYSIVSNKRAYLQGHTGSGKTTLIEQVAAYLNWPFTRINFDSEITRMDLIGRDTLKTTEEGQTISEFVDGILPRAMNSPYICCFDEIDFARPDVAYVMQAALEGNGLRITEDGDRVVRPNPMFRMFATGNTVGQGDEFGMYQGARAQSMAFLDRFTVWVKVPYLKDEERKELITRHYPTLSTKDTDAIANYVTEHIEAFEQGQISQPISPRGMLAVAEATTILNNLKEALLMTVLDRANNEDRSTLKGIIDRVV